MTITMKRTLTATKVSAVTAARDIVAEMKGDEFAVLPGFQPREGHIYVRVRAISARVNQNFDGFPSEELRQAYKTFLGKPCFVNHVNDDVKRRRGRVVAAKFIENGNDKYIDTFMEVNARKFPLLAKEIVEAGIDAVSMGCSAERTICSFCGNEAKGMFDMCEHVVQHKGQKLRRMEASGPKDVLVYEECRGIGFFELSFVFDPADETALASKVLVANRRATKGAGNRVWCDTPGCRRWATPGTEGHQEWVSGNGEQRTYDYCCPEHKAQYETTYPDWLRSSSIRNAYKRRGLRKQGYGEVEAPQSVDTLRDESDDDVEDFHQYVESPDFLNDPDLERAKELDRREDDALGMDPSLDAEEPLEEYEPFHDTLLGEDPEPEVVPPVPGDPTGAPGIPPAVGEEGVPPGASAVPGEEGVPPGVDPEDDQALLDDDDPDLFGDEQAEDVEQTLPDADKLPTEDAAEAPPVEDPELLDDEDPDLFDDEQDPSGELPEEDGGLDLSDESVQVLLDKLLELTGDEESRDTGDGFSPSPQRNEQEHHPRKGSTMSTGSLAQRGRVASRARVAEDKSRNDQGEKEDTFITQTPPAEPVETAEGDEISNTEDNLVAKRRRALRKASELEAAAKRLRAEAQGEIPDPKEVSDPDERIDMWETVEETQPKDASRKQSAGARHRQFARWVKQTQGKGLRQASSKAELLRWAAAFAKQSSLGVEDMYPIVKHEIAAHRKAAFSVGDKVKDGWGGLAGEDGGTVTAVDGDQITVKWDDGDTETYSSADLTMRQARTAADEGETGSKKADPPEFIQEKIEDDEDKGDKKESARSIRARRARARRKTADEKLDVAAPDGRVDVERPTEDTTDEDAQEGQFDKGDFGDNAGDDIADPDLSTDQNWLPGEGKKSSSVKLASGLQAVRLAEAVITANLDEKREGRWNLAQKFERIPAGVVADRTALLERVIAANGLDRRTAERKTAGSRGPSATKSTIPPNLAQAAAPRREASREVGNPDSDMFL